MNTKTKATPVVMSAQEVKALLAGDKTQIRVPVLTSEQVKAGYDWYHSAEGDSAVFIKKIDDERQEVLLKPSPFGVIGERLWVQEDWRIGAWREDRGVLAIDYRASPELTNTPWVRINDDHDGKKFESLWIETTDELDSKGAKLDEDGNYRWPAGQAPLEWRPAETMEQWASRILLEAINIRIERVQDITKADAIAMGVEAVGVDPKTHRVTRYRDYPIDKGGFNSAIQSFAKYWDSIHGAGAWDSNHWVWVADVEVITND